MAVSPFIAAGATIHISGRQFTAAAVDAYTRRDGAPSQLVTWRGHCAVCEAIYDVKGGRAAKHLPLNCEKHRGRRTRAKSLRTIPREAIEILENALQQKPELRA